MKNPTLRRNGKQMLTVRVTRHLNRDDLVDIIAHHLCVSPDEEPTSKTAAEKIVKQAVHEDSGWEQFWQERWADIVDEALERAEEIVVKLWPDWVA